MHVGDVVVIDTNFARQPFKEWLGVRIYLQDDLAKWVPLVLWRH
jgi:hypothetical protein